LQVSPLFVFFAPPMNFLTHPCREKPHVVSQKPSSEGEASTFGKKPDGCVCNSIEKRSGRVACLLIEEKKLDSEDSNTDWSVTKSAYHSAEADRVKLARMMRRQMQDAIRIPTMFGVQWVGLRWFVYSMVPATSDGQWALLEVLDQG
jgi:hypothetical protein